MAETIKKLADSCRHADYRWQQKDGRTKRLADMEVFHLNNCIAILDKTIIRMDEQLAGLGERESYKTQQLEDQIEELEEKRETLAEHLADRIQNNLPQHGE